MSGNIEGGRGYAVVARKRGGCAIETSSSVSYHKNLDAAWWCPLVVMERGNGVYGRQGGGKRILIHRDT